MIYHIENEYLKISANSFGAELFSVYSKKTGIEYLWQGDPEYWGDRALNLFPFIGRMYNKTYYYRNETFYAKAHGVARFFDFKLEERTATKLVFLLTENEETLKEYPFKFEYRVCFELNGTEVLTKYSVKNTDDKELICAFGGHPGINVPFDGGNFEDYYLEFSEATKAHRQLLSDSDCYMADKAVPYELEDGVRLHLQHNLFEHDAIILSNTCRCVSLKTNLSNRYVTMKYEDFKYIGFWQTHNDKTPFVCLEPWSALPATDGIVDVLETKADMIHVAPNKTAEAAFTLEIHE